MNLAKYVLLLVVCLVIPLALGAQQTTPPERKNSRTDKNKSLFPDLVADFRETHKAAAETQKAELNQACLTVDALWTALSENARDVIGEMSDDSLETLYDNASDCSEATVYPSAHPRKTYTAKQVALIRRSDGAVELVRGEQLRRLRQSIKTIQELPDVCKPTRDFSERTPEAETAILNKASLKELSSYQEEAWKCLSALLPTRELEGNYDGQVVEYMWNSLLLGQTVYLEQLRRSDSQVQFWTQGYKQLNTWVDAHLREDQRVQASFDALLAATPQAQSNQTQTQFGDFLSSFGKTVQQSIQAEEQLRLQRQQQWDVWQIGWELDGLNQTLKGMEINRQMENSQREMQRALRKISDGH